jgi:hypothetical protein
MGDNYWEIGFGGTVTENGSSGSPLINSNRRVIGQLQGPGHGPEYGCDNPSLDRSAYGKFSVSWTGNGNDILQRRLDHWLDPIGCNPITLNSISAYQSNPVPFFPQNAPSFICKNAPIVLTLNNMIECYTVNWIPGPNLSIEGSGNSATVSYIQNQNPLSITTSWVKAEIWLGDELIGTAHRDITIEGPPTVTSMQTPSAIYAGTPVFFTLNHNGPTTWPYPTWSVTPNTSVSMFAHSSSMFEIGFGIAGNYTVTANVSNVCGTTTPFSKTVTVIGNILPPTTCQVCLPPHLPPCKSCPLDILPPILNSIIYPNPADGTLYIDLDVVVQEQIFQASTTSTIQTFQSQTQQIFNIRLYNKQGNIVRQATATGGRIEFDIDNLPEDTYFLHVETNGEIRKEQVVVKR